MTPFARLGGLCAALAWLCTGCPGRAALDGGVDASGDVDARVGHTLGAACTSTCTGGLTCLTAIDGYFHGYCTRPCTGTTCPAGATCFDPTSPTPVCLLECQFDHQCRIDEGYFCVNGVCSPVEAPVGTRDGAPCFTIGDGGTHARGALARRTFATANLPVSPVRVGPVNAADGNLVVSPVRNVLATPFIGLTGTDVFIGSANLTEDTLSITSSTLRDATEPLTADPTMAYTRDGMLHVVFLAYRLHGAEAVETHVRIANSADDGATWGPVRTIDPTGYCTPRCDKPWVAVAPDDALYTAFEIEQPSIVTRALAIARSPDGVTWSPPTVFADTDANGAPQLAMLAVDPQGTVHAVYAAVPPVLGDASLEGDPLNRVVHRASTDGGVTWSGAHVVSRAGVDSPVYVQPSLSVTGSAIHVVYVTGRPSGAWDVVLGTSHDGGTTWSYRTVNDDGESCATHTLPVVLADETRNVAYITWLENRFGAGAVAFASCPDDATQACTANEQVSDAPFVLTTGRDPTVWHGDYEGLARAAGGDLWAAWSDTRSGTPTVYLAHGTP